MQAKLVIRSIKVHKNELDNVTHEELEFRAVHPEKYGDDGSDENNSFARFTPSLELKMTIENPVLFGQYHEGQEFYVGFTPLVPGELTRES